MSTSTETLVVKSHVARDLLQSAGLFTKDKLVIWEYVSNGLQYVDQGVNPHVVVSLDNKNKKISIRDNGRGMNWEGLNNFFFMHGENQDRKHGRPGRGFFGTGKSAAFGIANHLRVTTVQNKKRSRVELHREDIEQQKTGDTIPVKIIEREVPCNEQNGTLIEIEQVNLKSFDQKGIINYIERHLARWNKGVSVFVNNHLCEFNEPPISERFNFEPEGDFKDKLGDINLSINVSMSPLEEDLRGVSIFSNGVWHETTLAGSEGREMSQYIFGEVDIPKLDEDKSPIPPFNVSRSMQLNAENELVRIIYAFVSQNIEKVRRKLVDEEKKRKSDEQSRRLAMQANEIAQIINEDFNDFRQQIAKARAKVSGGFDNYQDTVTSGETNETGGALIFGSDVPAEVVSPTGSPGKDTDGDGGNGGDPPMFLPEVEESESSGDNLGTRAEEKPKTSKSRGGFQIIFRNMGEESVRAWYSQDERAIYINLDHPQFTMAIQNRTIDDPVFKRLGYEAAFSEYAIALSSELAIQGAYLDLFEPITDIRETLNRIVRKAAYLYAE